MGMNMFEQLAAENRAANELASVSLEVMLSARGMADRLADFQPNNHFVRDWPALEARWRAANDEHFKQQLEGLRRSAR